MRGEKNKILLVEDNQNLRLVLKDYLEMLNYEVSACSDGEEGSKIFGKDKFDLCILDIMMPVKDGFSLAQDIRNIDKNVPLIFLTARTLKEDKIKGFKIGADDYITKPFSTEELSLRIEAILRRTKAVKITSFLGEQEVFQMGIFTFDFSALQLKSPSINRSLTRKESDLLKLLATHKNTLIPREVILKTVWGEDDYFIGRSMDVFITKLRKYLKEDPNVNIKNIHGSGFKLEVITEDLDVNIPQE